jgi:tetratricopeptide (TPR) repeat protein
LHGLNEHLSTDGLARVLLIAKTYGWYLLLTFYPFTLVSPVHPERAPFTAPDPMAWLALVSVLTLMLILYRLARKIPHVGWSWIMYPLALLPVTNGVLLQITGNIVADRFLYFPLAFASLALAPTFAVINRWTSTITYAWIARTAVTVLLLLYACLSVASLRSMVPLWQSDLRLMLWAVQKYPDSPTAQGNLANIYSVAGDPRKGLEHAISALRAAPVNATIWSLVGNALADIGYCDDALRYQQVALAMNPLDHEIINNAGVILFQRGYLKQAEALLQHGLKGNPWNRRSNNSLIYVYLALGNRDKAQLHLDRSWQALNEKAKPKLSEFEAQAKPSCSKFIDTSAVKGGPALFPQLDLGDIPPLWRLDPVHATIRHKIDAIFRGDVINVSMQPVISGSAD